MLDSTEYIEPADRPAAWAAMARQYAARGWTHHDIAWALCVDEPTVDQLLDAGAAAQHDAAIGTGIARPEPAPAAKTAERGAHDVQATPAQ